MPDDGITARSTNILTFFISFCTEGYPTKDNLVFAFIAVLRYLTVLRAAELVLTLPGSTANCMRGMAVLVI